MKLMKVWSGTEKEFEAHRIRIVDTYDVLIIGGVAIDLREAKRSQKFGVALDLKGCLLVWGER